LWRISVEYLEQILYTLSALTYEVYWRRSQAGIVENLYGFNIPVETTRLEIDYMGEYSDCALSPVTSRSI
jgi:hypothetical protein